MVTKNILIISRTFYPENSPRSFRTTELAKELARQEHGVTVLLPANVKSSEMLDFAMQHHIKLEFYQPLVWKGLKRSKLFGDLSRKFGRLLFLFFEYPNIEIYFKLPKYLKTITKKYDLLISIAVPHENHWAVAKFQRNKKLADTWIADCGDPFVGNKLESMSPPFYFRSLENNFLKTADYISVPTAGAISAYNPKYRDKFRIIPQGFNFENVQLAQYSPDSTKIRFAYAGGVAPSGIRSPHQLINYLLSKEEIDFEFHIYSKNLESLRQLEQQANGKLVLHQAVSRDVLLYELSKMDFLVNLDNGMDTASPSKLIDYALTKRPVLNVSPQNIQKQLVDEFLKRNYTNQFITDNIEQYNIVNVAKSFLKLSDD